MKIDFSGFIAPIRKRQWRVSVLPYIFVDYERFQGECCLFMEFGWLVFNSTIYISW